MPPEHGRRLAELLPQDTQELNCQAATRVLTDIFPVSAVVASS